MKSGGGLGRLAIFLAFGLAAAAVFQLGRQALAPGLVPGAAELQKLEQRMAAEARLHPRPAATEPPGTATFCRACHSPVPHAGGGIAPAMHNEHAQILDCLLCHWSNAAGPRPAATWQKWPPKRSSSPREQLALYPLEKTPQDQLARLRTAAAARQKCFDRGPACGDCHRPGGLSGWVRPGVTAARISTLERLEDFFKLPPGGKWYFPQLR